MPESFAGRRVTVMGLGAFGGGIAAVRFLSEQGAAVTVTDLRQPPELADSLAQLADLPALHFCLGGHEAEDFTRCDLLVVNPAVKPDNPYLARARQAGTPVTSEVRLFWDRCRAPIIGVTGSNGKSTTATLIHDILQADGRTVWLGGNIGRSLLPEVPRIQPADWVVLELSSFQLADLDTARLSPHVAVVTNFTPNHLDWHGSVQEYAAAKAALLRWQTSDDIAIRHQTGSERDWPTAARPLFCASRTEPDPSTVISLEETRDEPVREARELRMDFRQCPGLRSGPQRSNAILAAATGLALHAAPAAIRTALESFVGIPHRLQSLGQQDGRWFINDSASTTPESTIAALEALDEAPVLIVGGTEKGSALEPLALAITRRARAAIMLGDVNERLHEAVDICRSRQQEQSPPSPLQTVRLCATLSESVEAAAECAPPGTTILFSPGFASGSMFRNFSDRGEKFLDLVQNRVKQ